MLIHGILTHETWNLISNTGHKLQALNIIFECTILWSDVKKIRNCAWILNLCQNEKRTLHWNFGTPFILTSDFVFKSNNEYVQSISSFLCLPHFLRLFCSAFQSWRWFNKNSHVINAVVMVGVQIRFNLIFSIHFTGQPAVSYFRWALIVLKKCWKTQ